MLLITAGRWLSGLGFDEAGCVSPFLGMDAGIWRDMLGFSVRCYGKGVGLFVCFNAAVSAAAAAAAVPPMATQC